ncbi:unnamed protein product [Sphagnum jensenii]|uniref:Uncharacterized protein n=1 Tax=Sphagnum jensenii TaxID=128206 RepID=A0ABP1BRI2_9BRYO
MFFSDRTNIESILQAARDIDHEIIQVAQIMHEYAFTSVHQLDLMSEGRCVEDENKIVLIHIEKVQQREGQKLDRTDNIQIIYDYYKKYQKRLDIANLEEEEER